MADTNPASVIAAGAVMPAVSAILLGARFYSRRKMKVGIEIDDWILIPGFLLLTGMGASLIAGVALRSLGYPTPHTGDPNNPLSALTTTNRQIAISSQVEWALQMMQILQLGCVKLSFLFFYRRIFVTKTRPYSVFSIATWVVIAIVVLWALGFFFAFLLACAAYSGSFAAWWGSVIDLTTKCVKTETMEAALVTSDFITDVIVLLMPIPKILSLHMTAGRKAAVLCVFALGLVSVAASIIRMKFFLDVIRIGFNPKADEDLLLTSNLYWSMVESGLGFIVVCLPTLRPIFGAKVSFAWLSSLSKVFILRSDATTQQQKEKVQGSSKAAQSMHSSKMPTGSVVNIKITTEVHCLEEFRREPSASV